MEKPKAPNCHNHVSLIIFSSFIASAMLYIYLSSIDAAYYMLFSQNIASSTFPLNPPDSNPPPHFHNRSTVAAGDSPSFTHQPNLTVEALVPQGQDPHDGADHSGIAHQPNVTGQHFTNHSFTQQPNVTVEAVGQDDGGADPCSGKYIFMHDLPPKFNTELLRECGKLLPMKNMCAYIQNDGFGPPIFHGPSGEGGFDPESWFATDQFTLELIFHRRMKHYECLTSNSSSANALYVPFYAGTDAGKFLWGYNTTVRDRVAVDFINYVSSLKEWKAMDGRDHFFVAGRIGWDFRRPGNSDTDWGISLMSRPQLKYITMLTIEASSFKNEVSIPYPTYFHPSRTEQITQWQKFIEQRKRRFLFAFAGAPRPLQPGSIRNNLFRQCSAARKNCSFLSCVGNHDGKCNRPLNVLKLFWKAKFCLQPPGDSPTRRSTFDAIISGCIPVFFRMQSGPEQYVWHFPRNHTSYSVYIPEEDVQRKKADIRRILSRISSETVKAMRREVIKMIPEIIYRKNGGTGVGLGEVEKDAFDVSVDGILRRVENIKREFFSGNESGLYF